MSRNRSGILVGVLLTCFALGLQDAALAQQGLQKLDLERAHVMLHDAFDNVKKNYYDPKFHGLDWEARFHEYDARLKTVTNLGQAFGVVAAFLDGLKDSHVYFRPPSRSYRMEYGFRMQLVGDDVFITQIRPGTDAASKTNLGDQVLEFGHYAVNRADFHTLSYYFNVLSPHQTIPLLLKDPTGQQRELVVQSRVQEEKKLVDLTAGGGGADIWKIIREQEAFGHLIRQRYYETPDVMIWKMPEFFLDDSQVDHLFGIAKKHKVLILDLRGNPGGLVVTLERMVGNVFDHDVKIADRVGRKELKPTVAKTCGPSAFPGKLIVIVDGASASAAELFARVVQLENRGTVIGDRSSGSVMEAKGYGNSQGIDVKIFYSFSITDADLIMKDGKSLEHDGVVPDEIILPSGKDIAEGKDPVLARAVELAGLKLDAVAAGKIFPFEWLPM